MPVKIHNKEYKTVAERVNEFHSIDAYKGWSIETDIHSMNGDQCIIKALVKDAEGRIRGTGLAHEVQGSTNINKTSHVENCETSAIGRALANIGLAGTEYASADEVSTAVINQAVQEAEKRFARHTRACLSHYESIMAIKQGIATEGFSEAAEEWFGLNDDVKADLWLAPSRGGVFTTKEREVMQSAEFRESYYGGASDAA
jgi:hypothetical protein